MNPVFIGGCERSGTTLLGSMLGGHSRCLTTPESHFVVETYRRLLLRRQPVDASNGWRHLSGHWALGLWGTTVPTSAAGSYQELIESLVMSYARQVGKPDTDIWVDHTPANARHAPVLLSLFPTARFIHLVRDGRAVTASVLSLDWGPNTAWTAAEWWTQRVRDGAAAETFFRPRAIRITYEELVQEPERTMKTLCDFLSIDFESAMLSGSGFHVPEYTRDQHRMVGSSPEASRIAAWRGELTPRQIEVFEQRAWNWLAAFGYELSHEGTYRLLNKREKGVALLSEMLYGRVINPYRIRARRRRIVEGPEQ